jgi:hypothetical protein
MGLRQSAPSRSWGDCARGAGQVQSAAVNAILPSSDRASIPQRTLVEVLILLESGTPAVRVQALEACSGQGTWFRTQPEPGSR